jgi:hypothetical protein
MINYEYTKVNRLNLPHNYMYTPYRGSKFLDAYFQDRIKKIKNLGSKKYKQYKTKPQLFIYSKVNKFLYEILNKKFSNDPLIIKYNYNTKKNDAYDQNKSKPLSSFSISEEIESQSLLLSLLSSQIDKKNNKLVKFWLDLLVQRFEVTKKIYSTYKVNFRKGKGDSNIVCLYLMLAISLTLFFCSAKKIKYMSTLLKLNDLICSLDIKHLDNFVPKDTLSMILLIELLNIKLISINITKNKKNYEFK